MRHQHSSSHGHHDDHHHDSPDHHDHDAPGDGVSSLSARDKLFIRLEHFARHIREHAESCRILADEATELNFHETARLLGAAAEGIEKQNENLMAALSHLDR